jgi:hypothetical protein
LSDAEQQAFEVAGTIAEAYFDRTQPEAEKIGARPPDGAPWISFSTVLRVCRHADVQRSAPVLGHPTASLSLKLPIRGSVPSAGTGRAARDLLC